MASSTLDILKNRDEDKPLGPFDSKVGAVVRIAGESYFITTNTNYIPALPIRESHTIFMRTDYRYGDDDPTRWPQQYSRRFCHLAAIPKQENENYRIAIMWWTPLQEDLLCPESGRSIIRGLGHLRPRRITDLVDAVDLYKKEYHSYEASLDPQEPLPLFAALMDQVSRGLERLKSLPMPYKRMAMTVTQLQRNFLEMYGLLRYMSEFKPQIDMVGGPSEVSEPPPRVHKCIGTFTTELEVAQQLRAAGLPYWLVRPMTAFHDENILALVEPVDPATSLILDPAPGFPSIPTAAATHDKIEAMRAAHRCGPVYRDPFESTRNVDSHVGDRSGAVRGSEAGPSNATNSNVGHVVGGVARGNRERNKPPNPSPTNSAGRNKFEIIVREEMPPSIPSWEEALRTVDRTRPVTTDRNIADSQYVFPEPALLISSENPGQRQLTLHHYTLLRDALFYRLGDEGERDRTVSTQQWRDLLAGKTHPTGRRSAQRWEGVESILGPALRACGVDEFNNFPADPDSVPQITVHRAREIVWDVAESNFRYEFLALDCRASGLDRSDECRDCFAGRTLINIPVEESKDGLAAISSEVRHVYILRMARLMTGWLATPPRVIMTVNDESPQHWSGATRKVLEEAVAAHYTQTFYEYFGRAAVIPMRLEHEFGT
ncbi:hypothetical protein C8R46DRAFT_1036056 [Mycena filopes]|nr:hypothetical protein C8R46DRAFT_1036056 [Mycena filopes]